MSVEPRQIDADNEGAHYGEEDLVVEKQSLSLGSFTGGRKAKKALARRAAAPVAPAAATPVSAKEPATPVAEVQPVTEAAPTEAATRNDQQETKTPETAMTKDEKIVPEKEIAVTPEAQKTEPEKAEASATAPVTTPAASAAAPVQPAVPVTAPPVAAAAAAPTEPAGTQAEAAIPEAVSPNAAPEQEAASWEDGDPEMAEVLGDLDARIAASRNARPAEPSVTAVALGGEGGALHDAAADELEATYKDVLPYDPDLAEGQANLNETAEMACSISCGDNNPEDEPSLSKATAAAIARNKRLDSLGFPPRPADWPHMMRWPSMRDLEILEANRHDRQLIDDYVKNLLQMNIVMKKRAGQVRAFLDTQRENPGWRENRARRKLTGTPHHLPDGRAQKLIKKAGRDPRDYDPQQGIRFAVMLDPSQLGASINLVAAWSEDVIRTRDGTNVYAGKNGAISFRVDSRYRHRVSKIGDDAIALSIREGISRGWKSFDVKGTKDFAKSFERIALELGVSATITYKVMGRTKTIKVHPPLPALDRADLQWNPANAASSGAALTTATSRKFGDPRSEPSAADPSGDPAAGDPAGLAPVKTSAAFRNMKPMPPAAAHAAETEQTPASKMKIEPFTAPQADAKAEAKPEIDIDEELKSVLGPNPDLDQSPAPQLA